MRIMKRKYWPMLTQFTIADIRERFWDDVPRVDVEH